MGPLVYWKTNKLDSGLCTRPGLLATRMARVLGSHDADLAGSGAKIASVMIGGRGLL